MENKEPLCRVLDIYRSINDFKIDFFARCNVKLNEGMLLCLLLRLERCSSGDIAEMLGLASSNSSKVIISAEKKGLIERIVGKDDKRQMFFQLTVKGKECISKIKNESNSILELIEKIQKI